MREPVVAPPAAIAATVTDPGAAELVDLHGERVVARPLVAHRAREPMLAVGQGSEALDHVASLARARRADAIAVSTVSQTQHCAQSSSWAGEPRGSQPAARGCRIALPLSAVPSGVRASTRAPLSFLGPGGG